MIPPNGKRGIGKPVIGIVETPCPSILGDKGHHSFSGPGRYGKSKYFPVSLIDAKDNILSRCSPATFARSLVAEHGFIHFDLSGEGLQVFDGISVNSFS